VEVGYVREILDKFTKQSHFGEHNMMIYPNLYTLREIYSTSCKWSLENNEAVFVLLHYLTGEDIRTYLKELNIDVNKYEKRDRSLLILGSAEDYFGSARDFLFYLNIINRRVLSRNKRGISIFMDMGSHYYRHRITDPTQREFRLLYEYEESLMTTLDLKVKILCLYHIKDLDILNPSQKDNLLRAHFRRYKVIADSDPNTFNSDNKEYDDKSLSVQRW
jgi:hypothetical protein